MRGPVEVGDVGPGEVDEPRGDLQLGGPADRLPLGRILAERIVSAASLARRVLKIAVDRDRQLVIQQQLGESRRCSRWALR